MIKWRKILSIMLALMLTIGLVHTSFVQTFAEDYIDQYDDYVDIIRTSFPIGYNLSDIDFNGVTVYLYGNGEKLLNTYYFYDYHLIDKNNNSVKYQLSYDSTVHAGENKITLDIFDNYHHTAEFVIYGRDEKIELSNIFVQQLPYQTDYVVGDEFNGLDFTGLELLFEFSNGSSTTYTFEYNTNYGTLDYNGKQYVIYLSGYSYKDLKLGDNLVTVSCEDIVTSFAVNGIESPVKSINVTKVPNKLDYSYNEDLDLSGFEMDITYNDGTISHYSYDEQKNNYYDDYEIIIELKNYPMISGKNSVTVEYRGQTDEFEINCIKSINNIKITRLPNKTFSTPIDLENTDIFNKEFAKNNFVCHNMYGAELTIYYSDGTKKVYNFITDSHDEDNIAIMQELYYLGEDSEFAENSALVTELGNYKASVRFEGHETVFIANNLISAIQTTLTDESTEISVTGVLSTDTMLKVIKTDVYLSEVKTSYDIKLLKDGKVIQPDSEITISIPSEYNDCNVFWVKDDGTKVNMNAKYIDGKYVFTTDHLSVYALVRKSTTLLGDVNGDGKVGIDDATNIQKYMAEMLDFTDKQKELADVNKDGKVGVDDVTLIQKHMAGLAVIE